MKILHAISVAFLSITLLSCRPHAVEGNGATGSEERNISKTFNSIEIEAPVDATITVQAGGSSSINLAGFENVLRYIKTEVRDNTLHVFIPESVDLSTGRNITASITCASLTDISISGAGNAKVSGNISAPEFSADISGAGSVSLQSLQTDRLQVGVSGAGTFKVDNGRARAAKYELSGVGKIKAYGLECERVSCELSGTGSAEVFATSLLDASVSGVGKISYRGSPKVTAENSGMGSITKEDGSPAPAVEHTGKDDDNDDTTSDNWRV